MGVKLFGGEICPLDLVKDEKTNKLSSTKIWMHIGNIILSKVMLTQAIVGFDLMLCYGGLVTGSYLSVLFLKWKFRDAGNIETASPPKE